MNYPIWDIPILGGGLLVAVIATVHVYIAHFAVGGGLFLVLTEMKARRENDTGMLDFVQTHTRFFLLVTMVMGALTGVAIWLVISVLHPSGTSVLIHAFVFGWATEWVFFIIEIVSLVVYYFTFQKMKPRDHIVVGWIYFIAAWLSLGIIAGIVSFMLTPGNWPETGRFWDGFLNPSYLPSLVFRTAFALILAGVYGLITSSNIRDAILRQKMVRYCVLWLALPFLLLLPSGYWYLAVVPEQAKELIMGGSPEMGLFTGAFLWITPILILVGLFCAVKLKAPVQKTLVYGLLVVAFLYMGSFEMIREAGRRPFIIYGHMYSNSILTTSLQETQQKGVLQTAKWVENRDALTSDPNKAGRELFRLMCLSCHSKGGLRNDILTRVADKSLDDLLDIMETMGEDRGFMPPFPGNEAEREALSADLLDTYPSRPGQ
jgi:cytochrome bd-type quinol oxidase subunit 1